MDEPLWVIELPKTPADVAEDGTRTLQRTFMVRFADHAARSNWGIVGIDIYRNISTHPDDTGARAITASAVEVDNAQAVFEITYVYTSGSLDTGTADGPAGEGESEPGAGDAPPGQTGNNVNDPTKRAMTVSVSTKETEVAWEKDDSDPPKPIQNSARQMIKDLTRTKRTKLYRLQFWWPRTVDVINKALRYEGTVNNFPFEIYKADGEFPEEVLKINSIDFEHDFTNDAWYKKITMEIEYDREGWVKKVPDMGNVELYKGSVGEGTPDKWLAILDSDGNVIDPVPFHNGKRKTFDPSDPNPLPDYLEFRDGKLKDWDSLFDPDE